MDAGGPSRRSIKRARAHMTRIRHRSAWRAETTREGPVGCQSPGRGRPAAVGRRGWRPSVAVAATPVEPAVPIAVAVPAAAVMPEEEAAAPIGRMENWRAHLGRAHDHRRAAGIGACKVAVIDIAGEPAPADPAPVGRAPVDLDPRAWR